MMVYTVTIWYFNLFLIDALHVCIHVHIVPIHISEYLIQNGHMKEEDAKMKFCQIVKAVDYCHQHSIVHRDLKVCLGVCNVHV